MYSLLISLICIILTACGNNTANISTPTTNEPTAIASTTPVIEETQLTSTSSEPEEHIERSDSNKPLEPGKNCFVDGVFYPNEYAEQLGFKIYNQSETEDCFSKTQDGVEYFMRVDFGSTNIYWVKDGMCYGYTLYEENAYEYKDDPIRIHTGTNFETNDSKAYYQSIIDIMNRLQTNNDLDNIKNWDFGELSNTYVGCDCDPVYWPEDGYINSNEFKNVVDEVQNYKKRQ